MNVICIYIYFFFQAEDGIRYGRVTGVQTCALPICIALGSYIIDNAGWVAEQISQLLSEYTVDALQSGISWLMGWPAGLKLNNELGAFLRSEERRVGKECRSRLWAYPNRKNILITTT